MPLAQDLVGVQQQPEQAKRYGDTVPRTISGMGGSTQALATQIGGYLGATLLECNPTTNNVSSVVFLSSTEVDREFTIENVSGSNAMNVFPPTGGSFNGLSNNTSFSIPANKVAYVVRFGPMPPPTGSVASDRWVYGVSN